MKSFFERNKHDIAAGVVVYFVALPLCLGIALASTARSDLLFSGITAGFVGGIIVGWLSGSSVGVSGPAAGLVVIVLNSIATLGSYEAFLTAVVLAGCIQLVAGLLKAGFISYFFPSSVIKGMLAAIGLLLIIKEIPHALGLQTSTIPQHTSTTTEDGLAILHLLINAIQHYHPGSLLITATCMALLVLFETLKQRQFRLFTLLPPALFVVLTGAALNFLLGHLAPHLQLKGPQMVQLPVPENLRNFLSFFSHPDLKALANIRLYDTAILMAVVGSIETLLSVEATDKMDPEKRKTPVNRELVAQGIGNITSGLLGGLPITQVVVRSSANISAGGKTKKATIIHGILLLASAALIPAYLNTIPLAALAVILLMVGYKLTRLSLYKNMFKAGPEQFIPFATTIAAILYTNLLTGIAIGMFAAIFLMLRKNYKRTCKIQSETLHNHPITRIILPQEVTFLNKGSIMRTLHQLPPNSHIIIDASHSTEVDFDVAESIHEFKSHSAPKLNITVELLGIPHPTETHHT